MRYILLTFVYKTTYGNKDLVFKDWSKGPSINDVSSKGEGGGPPSKPIYYISLFSNLSRQGEGGGS